MTNIKTYFVSFLVAATVYGSIIALYNPAELAYSQIGTVGIGTDVVSHQDLSDSLFLSLLKTLFDDSLNSYISTYAYTFVDDINEATFKATVNLEIGTDVEAYDASIQLTVGTVSDDSSTWLLDSDFGSAGFMYTDGAGNYSIATQTTAQASFALGAEIDGFLSDALGIWVWGTSPITTQIDQSGESHPATPVNVDANDWTRNGFVRAVNLEDAEYYTVDTHTDLAFLSGTDDADVSFGGRAQFYSDTNVKTLMSKYDGDNSQAQWWVQANTTETLYVAFFDNSAGVTANEGRVTDVAITDGWHDWVVTYDSAQQGENASDGMTIYIDGQVVASSVSDGVGTYVDKEDVGNLMAIGTRLDNDTPGDNWIGNISYCWIEQSTLSAADVFDLYNITRKYVDPETNNIHLPVSGVLTDAEYFPVKEITWTAGYGSTAFADIVYLNNDDSKFEKTQANAAATAADVWVGIAVQVVAENAPCKIMLEGTMTNDAWNWSTVGASLWLSDTTAGALLATKPDTAGDIVRPVAYVLDDDTIYFHGENAYATVE